MRSQPRWKREGAAANRGELDSLRILYRTDGSEWWRRGGSSASLAQANVQIDKDLDGRRIPFGKSDRGRVGELMLIAGAR